MLYNLLLYASYMQPVIFCSLVGITQKSLYFYLTVGTLGFPGTLIYCFQVTSKVTERQYLYTSCLQAYPILELNPLLEKLIFNVRECFQVLGTLTLSHRSLQSKNVPNLERNTAQSGNKLNKYEEKFFFTCFQVVFSLH